MYDLDVVEAGHEVNVVEMWLAWIVDFISDFAVTMYFLSTRISYFDPVQPSIYVGIIVVQMKLCIFII